MHEGKYFPLKSSKKSEFVLPQVQTLPRVKVLGFSSPESGEGIWPLKKLEVKCQVSTEIFCLKSLTVV